MRLLLPFLALTTLVSAQYFSAGWQPGQPAHDIQDPPAPTYTPGAEQPASQYSKPKSLSELFSINTILTLPPIASAFQRFGINITERVELTKVSPWDDRVPLITDDNYQDLIVNEPLTKEEEQDRVWVLVISVTAAKQDGISKFLDQVFDSAYNETIYAHDLPNVRWGRIDYLNVTHITTKWNVWQPPYLVILSDRGQSLRFYPAHQLRLRDGALRDFLLTEGWKTTPTWQSRYAPGGDREWIMDIFATYLTNIYNFAVVIPRWLLLIITGGIGSVILSFLHRPSKKRATPSAPVKREATPAPAPQTTTEKQATPTPASAVKVKSEATASTASPTASPRRNGKKGKGKKHQA